MPTDFSIGEKLRVTIFGQSHGPAVGCVIEGLPTNISIDWDRVNAFMARRAPGKNAWSTARTEADQPEILSGLNDQGQPCGAALTAVIRNSDAHSKDYSLFRDVPRPGHADFTAMLKYGDAADLRGGGPFSARLTAPLCFAGAVCMQYLEQQGVQIAAHIARIGNVADAAPDFVHPTFPLYEPGAFPVIDQTKGEAVKREIEAAKQNGDSLGGAVRCMAVHVPQGLGGPYFGGLEGKLAQALFAIPAVKGVQFGDIQDFGSQNNDAYCLNPDLPSGVGTATNHCGGILGGISNGMPIHFTVTFKPTPSIAQTQKTLNIQTRQETELAVPGRHDPCVVPRAVPVVEAVTALVLTDILLQGA